MKQHQAYANLLAAGLAALFITGCGAEAAQAPTVLPPTPAVAVLASAPAASLSPTPSPLPTSTAAAPSPTPTVSVTPTLSPTAEATQALTVASGAAKAMVSETSLTLPTYPIWDFLTEQIDPFSNVPAFYFDRAAYEAAGPAPTPKTYTGVVLENAYLRLTFLPELGGRLYSAVVKATGQEIFYHNPVVKPSRYGVLSPAEANWWLATGGMEWAYPTQEHGYRFGVPWQYVTSVTAEGASITLSDMAEGRVGAEVQVTLPPDSAAFMVVPKLTNQTSHPVAVQFWLNAALTLGSASMSPQTQFVLPQDQVIVHSRGEPGWNVPAAQQESPWPQVSETDLGNYSQWANYLGVFVPNLDAPFVGAYNPDTNLGVARLIRPGAVPGSKLFAFGQDFPDKSYTDDGSQYFEIWGGANRSFWSEDDVTVPSGGTVEWWERWWPLAGLGGLTWANENAAIYLDQTGVSLLTPRPTQGIITVLAAETPILTESFNTDPATPLHWNFAASAQPVRVQLMDQAGTVLLDYQPKE